MGDKNNVVAATADLLVKTGHGIIKAIYVTQAGDRIFTIRDGIAAGGGDALFAIDTSDLVLMPYINHPVNAGLFADSDAGTTGTLLIVYE